MKKRLIIALGTAAVAAMAVPAFADHQIGGYFRNKFVTADTSFTKDGNDNPEQLVDQRLRMRWQNNINEYITVVWFGEVDFNWGGPSKGNIGAGGALGGDGVNVESKHAFATVKIPNTPVAATLGLQNVNDLANLILDDDAAGIQVGAKLDMVNVNLQYAKFSEGSVTGYDDMDFLGLEASLAPIAGLNLGLGGYWKNDNVNNGDLYWVMATPTHKVDIVKVEAILGYNFGEENDTTDVSGYMASIKGGATVAGVDAGVRLLYMSGDNDDQDANFFHNAAGQGNNAGGRFSFGIFDGLMIFGSDITATSYSGDQAAYTKAGFTDHGLMALIASAKYVPPAMKAMYAQAAVGYFQALEDDLNRAGQVDTEGTSLGTEVAARVGYKIAEKFDVSLNGAYAFLGDFFDSASGNNDPDNPYKLYLMANIPY